jgi:drug/metabolite transporter (DMT)-like permease
MAVLNVPAQATVRLAAPLAVACLLLNAFVWGVSWWPFRLLGEQGLHALWATTFIYSICCIAIVVWRPNTVQQIFARPHLVWLMLGSGMTNASFNWAVTIGDVVRVVLLFYLMPVWSSLLARWLLKEPISLGAIARIILALVGAVLVLGQGQQGLPLPRTLVDALAILGGMSFALNNVLLRKYSAEPEHLRAFAMFAGGVLCAGFIGLVLWSQGLIAGIPTQQFGWVLPALGLTFAFLLANLGLQWGAANLTASVTAVVMLSEVLFAAVSSVFAGVTTLTWALWVGGALIVAASVLSVVQIKKG